ncbi:hypothetical protein BT69DRAFT_1400587 [Atractiella rhizophila]|nr:hypothetical protein BT69DRAFT_1400587 [Atractiella rhizophila]
MAFEPSLLAILLGRGTKWIKILTLRPWLHLSHTQTVLNSSTIALELHEPTFVFSVIGLSLLCAEYAHEDSFYTDGVGELKDVLGIIGFAISIFFTLLLSVLLFLRRSKSSSTPPYSRKVDLVCDLIAAGLVVGLVFAVDPFYWDYSDLSCLHSGEDCQQYAEMMDALQVAGYAFSILSGLCHLLLVAWSVFGLGKGKDESIPLSG